MPSAQAAPSPRRQRLARAWLAAAWVVCASAALGGMAVLSRYAATGGEGAEAPARWPEGSALELDGERLTLLVFAHPRCPCTRASLEELDRVVAHCAGRLRTSVVFTVPPGLDPEWARAALWSRASRMAQVEARLDLGGAEARRFGARTSGQALLYGPQGRLLFAGGLTSARGHEGPSEGSEAVVRLARGAQGAACEGPVFGCPLLGADG